MIQTPKLTVDGIVELYNEQDVFQGIVMIERKNPPHGWAFPGGFVDLGESVETALLREMKEEVCLDVVIDRFQGIYSDPSRDPRFHTASAVFVCRASKMPVAADDARAVHVLTMASALQQSMVFDHRRILQDYFEGKQCVTS